MDWFIVVVLTFLAFGLTQAIYVVSQAVIGWWVGATVEAVSVGFGPVVFEKMIKGVAWRISAIPTGGYTKFYGHGDEFLEAHDLDAPDDFPAKSRFSDLSIPGRAAIMLIGPLSSIFIGLICIATPVFTGGDQVVVDNKLPQLWKKNGVPHLTIAQIPSTWLGQQSLFESTVLEYSNRLVTFKSQAGWGGFVGWTSTLGSAGLYSWTAWLSCFGATMFGLGIANLLPIPVLNGGHLVVLMIEFALGRHPEKLAIKATYVGLILVLLVMGRMILADVAWFSSVR